MGRDCRKRQDLKPQFQKKCRREVKHVYLDGNELFVADREITVPHVFAIVNIEDGKAELALEKPIGEGAGDAEIEAVRCGQAMIVAKWRGVKQVIRKTDRRGVIGRNDGHRVGLSGSILPRRGKIPVPVRIISGQLEIMRAVMIARIRAGAPGAGLHIGPRLAQAITCPSVDRADFLLQQNIHAAGASGTLKTRARLAFALDKLPVVEQLDNALETFMIKLDIQQQILVFKFSADDVVLRKTGPQKIALG